jgi:hypothetical protein
MCMQLHSLAVAVTATERAACLSFCAGQVRIEAGDDQLPAALVPSPSPMPAPAPNKARAIAASAARPASPSVTSNGVPPTISAYSDSGGTHDLSPATRSEFSSLSAVSSRWVGGREGAG